MPTVPTYDDFKVAQSDAPVGAIQGPQGPSAGEIAGAQTQQLGQGLERVGDTTARVAVQMQDMTNQVRVNDAVNQARQAAQDLAYNPQTGYLNLKGPAALERPGGEALPAEYGDKLQQSISDIASSLGNAAQRRAFQIQAGDLSSQFNGQVEQHMLSEFREHALSVQDGTINLASDDAKRNWNNPDVINPSLAAAQAAVYQKGQVSGWSASQTQAAMLATTSIVHTNVIASALENNNPDYAVGYFNAHKGDMTADDILRVQGHITTQVNAGIALSAVQGATKSAITAVAPSGFDRMSQITAQAESGNRETNPDGGTVTSAKGAQGVMQVMPKTSADPGYGVKPAQDDSPAERARVGRDYLQAMLQRYGDPAKAWAAYNAGPDNVDKAIADAAKDAATGAFRGGPPPANAWMDKLAAYQTPENHAQTVAYVAGNMKQLNSNATVVARPTELDFVNDAVGRLPPGASPLLVATTRTQAQQQFGVISKSLTETADNALLNAQRWLTQNPTATVERMPPELMDPLRQYAPGRIDDLMKFSRSVQRGDTVTNNGRYENIVSHMDQYAKLPDGAWDQLQTELSPTDFRRLSQERANYNNGTSTNDADNLNRAQVNRSLNQGLAGLGIPTTVAKNDTAGQVRLGGIRKFVDQSIFDAQQATGKKMTPAEVSDHINQLFAASVDFKNTLFGITTGNTSQNLMSMTVGDLPSGAYDGIKRALIMQGNKAPSDTDVLNVYRKLHTSSIRPRKGGSGGAFSDAPPSDGQDAPPNTVSGRAAEAAKHPLDFLASGVGLGDRGEDDEPNY